MKVLSQQAAQQVKEFGQENDLIARISATEYFKPIWSDLGALMDPKTFIGRAPEQVDKFVKEHVQVALEGYKVVIEKGGRVDLNV